MLYKNTDWCDVVKKEDANPNEEILNSRCSNHSDLENLTS